MRAARGDPALVQNDNAIGDLKSVQPMRDQKNRAAMAQFAQGAVVERRGDGAAERRLSQNGLLSRARQRVERVPRERYL